jgi:hypothetical protein
MMTTACARRLGTAAVSGLAGVGAMVGSVDASGAQTQPNACELLTQNDAKKILGKTVRRETNLAGTQATSCSYVVTGDTKRVIGLGVGTFASADEATNAYTRARANAQFDGLKIQKVRKLGDRAYYLPKTNNFERTVRDKRLAFGEVTVIDGQDVYTAFVTPPSKTKATETIKKAIDRRSS